MSVKIGFISNAVNKNNIESNMYLMVNSCGIGVNEAEENKNFFIRSHGTKDYQIIIVFRGTAIFKYNDKDIILSSDEMILIPPGIKNEYKYNSGSYTMWVHFSGTALSKILKSYNIEPLIKYKLSNSKHFIPYAERIINELQIKKVGFINNCNSYLLYLLTLAKREIDEEIKKKDTDTTLMDLQRVVEDMKINYTENKSIAEYAKLCNLSVYRFIHIFSEKFGVSPYQFLLNIKISRAQYLLTDTDVPIADISKTVGYDDQFYFSRLFKKHTGLSPLQYRKMKR